MAEVESEFLGYTGDCVWAAVHMAAHRLAPAAWPVPSATILNRLTSAAIAAGIGVGPRGEADPAQLETMLTRWGMRFTRAAAYTGAPIPQAQLVALLDAALARGQPVLLGFTNGQALAGDEVGLHGHEIAVLHPATAGGYPCGDGDNPRCAAGELVYYPAAMLAAAQADSAYVLEEVPAMGWTKQADGTGRDAQGHTCGTGIMGYIETRQPPDGLLSETYYTQNDSFLPLADGRIVTAHHDAAAGWQIGEWGAQALVAIWQALQQAKAQAPAPDPVAAKASAALALLKAALAAQP